MFHKGGNRESQIGKTWHRTNDLTSHLNYILPDLDLKFYKKYYTDRVDNYLKYNAQQAKGWLSIQKDVEIWEWDFETGQKTTTRLLDYLDALNDESKTKQKYLNLLGVINEYDALQNS